MNFAAAIFVNFGASLVVLGDDLFDKKVSLIAKQAAEVASAAAADKNSTRKFATVGVYAALLLDNTISVERRKSLQESLRSEQIKAPKLAASERKSRDDLQGQIKKLLDNHESLSALNRVGQLVTFYEIVDLDPLDSVKLLDAVRDIAEFCPKCYGERKELCNNPGCDKKGRMQETKPCDLCKSGRITCPSCNGSLWIRCDRCGGTGQDNKIINNQNRILPCDKCLPWHDKHRGSVRCIGCKEGTVVCTKCGGNNTFTTPVKCKVCDKGKMPCTDCNGSGARKP